MKSCVLCGGRDGVRSFHRAEATRIHGSDLRASFALCPGCFDGVRSLADRSGGLYRFSESPTAGADVVRALWPPGDAAPEPPREIPGSFEAAVRRAVSDLRSRLLRNPDADEVVLHLLRESSLGSWLRKAVYEVACEEGWRPPTPEQRQEAAEKLQVASKKGL